MDLTNLRNIVNDWNKRAIIESGLSFESEEIKMKITIYAKKRTTKDGKTFHVYLSKLTKKDGTETPVTVHFKMTAGLPNPDKCPCVIEFDRKNGNVSKKERHFAKTDVVTGEIYEETSIDTQLWISEYKLCDGEYIDTSMDEFAD